jgi:Chromo (CHRromatin Organisation MOdifier) domain
VQVEECVDWRMVGGKREFLIKWKNFAPKNNTWEPESNLDCPQLMKRCLEKVIDHLIN